MSDLHSMVNIQVISGGQTGVDVAGLRAARCLGYRTGGYAPAGFKTINGPQPGMAEAFGLIESVGGYASRTRKNVDAADVTLVVAADMKSAGTKLTINTAEALSKRCLFVQLEPDKTGQLPYALPAAELIDHLVNDLKKEMELALKRSGTFVINVAGNSSKSAPKIFITSFILLVDILNRLYQSAGGDKDPRQAHMAAQLSNPGIATSLEDNYRVIPDLDPKFQRMVIMGDFKKEQDDPSIKPL